MSKALPKKEYEKNAKGPLAGVRVIDLSRLVAGNTVTQLLGDFGAEIIKVEPLAGDTLRAWKTKGIAANWKLYSRNKKSLCLELRNTEARDIVLKLVQSASVFIESFRPGMLETIGLGPATLFKINPKLIIVRISGWGQDGPYSKRPGFGTLVEGMSGFAAINGFDDREPVLPPMYLADTIAGLYGAAGVLVALREVEHSGGHGQIIDLPLLDPLFATLGPQAANYRLTGKLKPRTGSRSTNAAPRNAYKTKDGKWVCLSASTQKMTERLFRSIERADLIDNPRYRVNAERVKNAAELDAIIGTFVAARSQAENVTFFEKEEVTIGPIYDIAQIVEDPHVLARELVADYPDTDMGSFPQHHVVPRLSGTPATIRTQAAALGEHNRALLAELGSDAAAYEKLLAAGAVSEGQTPTEGET